MVHERVLVVTLPLGGNYGGVLQAYALRTFIERLGYQVETTSSWESSIRSTVKAVPGLKPLVK